MIFQKTISYLALATLFFAGAVFAEPYAEPSGVPLGSNVSPTITTGGSSQTKLGTFWAQSIGSDAGASGGFCFGSDCRTTWPASAPKRCHLEWKEVHASASGSYPDFYILPGFDAVSGLCDDLLTPASVAAGWVATGNDHCMRIGSSDCQRPRSCIFTRLQCSGMTVTAPTKEVLIHPASDPADEFATAVPRANNAPCNGWFCLLLGGNN